MEHTDIEKIKNKICPKCNGRLDEIDYPNDVAEDQIARPFACYACNIGFNVIYEFKEVHTVGSGEELVDEGPGIEDGAPTPTDIDQI